MMNETITLYCYHKPTNSWKRHVLYNAMWSSITKREIVNNQVVYNQAVSITITDNRDYTDLLNWNKTEPTGWTIDNKSNLSVVVRGRCLKELDADYTITDLKKDFETTTIKAFNDNWNKPRLRNFKIIGS